MSPTSRRTAPSADLEPLEPRALLSYTFFGPNSLVPDSFTRSSYANIVYADFDGDGIPDRAVSNNLTISFAKGAADGSFGPDRTTTFAAPVGIITAGRFDGSGRYSLVAIGTRGGPIDATRANPGFRIRAIAFDPAAVADSGDTTPGAFVLVTELDTTDYSQRGLLPRAYAGDFLAGWRDEFVLNLGQANNRTDLAVFSFLNRSTITLAAHVYTSANPLSGLAVANTIGSGKSQIITAEAVGTTSVIKVISPDTRAQWHTTTARVFPTDTISFAAADMDGDQRADIVALPVAPPNAFNAVNASARVWLLHSNGDGTFAAPRALTPRLSTAAWSSPAPGDEPGLPSIADIGDLNGDGRPDVVITSVAVFYYRLNNYSLLLTGAIQQPDGTLSIVPTPITLDSTEGSSYFFSLFSGIHFVNAPDPLGHPSLLVNGIHLYHPVTDPQSPQLRNFAMSLNVIGGRNPGIGDPVLFSAQAFDVDEFRGGSIAHVDYYIDVNQNGVIDAGDILAGSTFAPNARGYYELTAPIDQSWGTVNAMTHALAVAVDDTGLTSNVMSFEFLL